MSQVQTMGGGGSPAPSVEYVQGNSGGPVGPDGAYITYLIGDTTQGIEVNGNAGTFTETFTARNATAAATAGAAQKGVSSYDSAFFTVTSGYVTQANAVIGTAQTIGAVTADVITFVPPLTAGNYKLTYEITAFDSTTPSGSSYELKGNVVSDGVNVSTQGTPVRVMIGNETVFSAELVDVIISAGTTIILRVTGVAAKTIRWTAKLEYLFGGP